MSAVWPRHSATASWNSDYTGYDYTARIGQSLGLIYGYVFDGVYQTSDFNVNAATGEYVLKEGVTDITDHAGVAVKPGMVKYKDTDGDGVITTADRTVICWWAWTSGHQRLCV